jgi:hypothetical protein
VLLAGTAELAQFEPVLEDLFVLAAEVIYSLAGRTLKFYHVVLGHTFWFKVCLWPL